MHWQAVDPKRYIAVRAGQKCFGETITVLNHQYEDLPKLRQQGIRFVILGIEESVGVKANFGRQGAEACWQAFLQWFLPLQVNEYQSGKTLALGGSLSISSDVTDPQALRELVSSIDLAVELWTAKILENGLVPVVIGGGHNNSFPLIKAAAAKFKGPIGAINIDAHLDLRAEEGRHSGNGFSYAINLGHLDHYVVLYAQRYLANQSMLDYAKHHGITIEWLESLMDEEPSPKVVACRAIEKMATRPWGLEFCLDAVSNMPSSAMSPVGITTTEGLKLVRSLSGAGPKYAHFAEGAPKLLADGERMVGKFLAALVMQFVEAYPAP